MRIHHVALRTVDVARLERFYVDVIGVPRMERPHGTSTWLDAGGTILMIERNDDGEPALDPTSKELIAFGISPGEHAAVLARLERAGVRIEARTEYTLYVRDPDGRRVGVSSYPDPLV